MKRVCRLTIVFSWLCITAMFAQGEKVFVKSLTLTTSSVVTDLEGKVTFEEWDKDFVRVQVTVKIHNTEEQIIQRLAAVGRYDIIGENKDGNLLITMPKIATPVRIKGVLLQEEITYQILVPERTTTDIILPLPNGEGL